MGFGLTVKLQWAVERVITGRYIAFRIPLVHIGQFCLHFIGGNHRYLGESEWLENIFVDVLIQTQASDSLEEDSSPVDVNLRGIWSANIPH